MNLFFCQGCIMGPGTSECGEKLPAPCPCGCYTKKRLANFDEEEMEKKYEKHSKI